MNFNGWRLLVAADENPSRYTPTEDLFTADRSAIFGTMLKTPGDRYNSEINGTRKSGWGAGQNLDFQQTAPFLALRADMGLSEAIAQGLLDARKDGQIAKDMREDTSEAQMLYWMRELTEIALLDFIFSQQDRVGNIDFVAYWYWVEDGVVKSQKADHHAADPGELAQFDPLLLKRSQLNDNDAGGRVEYANFAKTTGMLERLHHFSGDTYAKLMKLDADFSTHGPIFVCFRDTFGLTLAQVSQIVHNTSLAAGIIRQACAQGELRFDLEPEEFLLTGSVVPKDVAC